MALTMVHLLNPSSLAQKVLLTFRRVPTSEGRLRAKAAFVACSVQSPWTEVCALHRTRSQLTPQGPTPEVGDP